MRVTKRDGTSAPLEISKLQKAVAWASNGLDVSQSEIELNAHIQFFDGITTDQIQKSLIQSAAGLVDIGKQDYEYAAARLLLLQLYKEVSKGIEYPTLQSYIAAGIDCGRLTEELYSFDLERLNAAIKPERDFKFKYLGLQTLYDRYLIRDGLKLLEMPQHFWMRVAMGVALAEDAESRTTWAIKFYEIMSTLEYIPSTPTLFNSGTKFSQMSSCFVLTTDDSIWEEEEGVPFGRGIFATMTEAALYSKFAGGIGCDFSRIRAAGAPIRKTAGVSSGVIPYLRVFNDTAVAVNQSGKRNASFAPYLAEWHGDVERFLDLKKPNGDERLRARELFPYLWVSDLFMERVREKGKWSLFCPNAVPELNETYGDAFKKVYLEAEADGRYIKQVDAVTLWREAITALVESGAPMITFKDEHNRRSTGKHVGMVRSSNLCSETSILSDDQNSGVCNLGSINVSECDVTDFGYVIPTAMRMLDNVVTLNFYPTVKAQRSNFANRPVGLGLMGWTDLLAQKNIDWESDAHLRFTDYIFEQWSYWAIKGSVDLAAEKGAYPNYEGSSWSQGILPVDTARSLPDEWMCTKKQDYAQSWELLRTDLAAYGIRNSLCMALAPTATISNLAGTSPCIEPVYKDVFMKDNKSGKFKVVDPTMRHGNPVKTAFNIDQTWLIKAAAVRQRYIDQSQSVNIFKPHGTKGSTISGWYFLAWELGLKGLYYLKNEMKEAVLDEPVLMCSIDNPDCESCQ